MLEYYLFLMVSVFQFLPLPAGHHEDPPDHGEDSHVCVEPGTSDGDHRQGQAGQQSTVFLPQL